MNRKEKYSAVVVLYNPKNENILNLKIYLTVFDKLYVFDNSDCSNETLFNNKCIEYCYFGENKGLSVPYNMAIEKSKMDGYDFLCILDQDSHFSDKSILEIINVISKDTEINSTGIYCPRISVLNGQNNRTTRNIIEKVDWAINSGSFINLNVIKQYTIRYDDNYFLDRLDKDFCKQIKDNNLYIKRINNSVLEQELGEVYNGKIIHSPIRNYYMARNRLYYNKKYFSAPLRWIYNLSQTIRHLFEIISVRKDVFENVKMILIGVDDYFKGIMGRKNI